MDNVKELEPGTVVWYSPNSKTIGHKFPMTVAELVTNPNGREVYYCAWFHPEIPSCVYSRCNKEDLVTTDPSL